MGFTSEIDILFKNITYPYVDTIIILFRINELLLLKKENIDWENETITGGLKTDAGKDRIIPIHPKIRDLLKKRYDSETDRLFTKEDGTPLTDNYYRKNIYYPILKKLKIEKKMIHSTRHTTATLLAQGGTDMNAIKQILGHTNYAFTADTYTHVDLDFLKNELQKI